MRIFRIVIFFIIVLFPAAASANGQVTGKICNTDILATLDGFPIESYSLDGKTAVALEDLSDYGFKVEYDNDRRQLFVWSYGTIEDYTPQENVFRGTVGGIRGYTYATDITAKLNGLDVPVYNIGGKLAAAIEDIGDAEHSRNSWCGWSDYLMRYRWDPETRTIALETVEMLPNGNRDKLKEKNATLTVNVYKQRIEVFSDDLEGRKADMGGGFDIVPSNTIISLNGFMDGKQVGTGFAGYAYGWTTGRKENERVTATYCVFPEFIETTYNAIQTKLTAADTLEYLKSDRKNGWPVDVLDEFYVNDAVILHVSQLEGTKGHAHWLYKVNPDGTYRLIDYLGETGCFSDITGDPEQNTVSYKYTKNNGESVWLVADLNA